MRCPYCGSSDLTGVVTDPSRFREERAAPENYICSGCNRILPKEMIIIG